MKLKEFKERLQKISEKGFVLSKRVGNTGIGYTLESRFGIKENNIRLPDLGKIELKSKRRGTSSFVTMFTFNSGAWIVPQAEVIEEYGYLDERNRNALKCAVSNTPNPQDLLLTVKKDTLQLRHRGGRVLASWTIDKVMEYFSRKMPALIIVQADRRINDKGREEFHYNEAHLLQKPSRQDFIKAIRSGHVVVELRMHLKKSGQVRNRGTAFRIAENDLLKCFGTKKQLL